MSKSETFGREKTPTDKEERDKRRSIQARDYEGLRRGR
jgi:hypothetical protein